MSDKTKTITAKQSARRGQHFWDAFNGLTVKINHQRFPDGIFELTYRKRQACFSDEPRQTNEETPMSINEQTIHRVRTPGFSKGYVDANKEVFDFIEHQRAEINYLRELSFEVKSIASALRHIGTPGDIPDKLTALADKIWRANHKGDSDE